MKLIIQIPCYNEEESLPVTLSKLPRQVEGFDQVEWLIINDGSTDQTAKIAKELGADHLLNFKKNLGLAKAFSAGLNECVKLDADVIVNTDADNQYDASCIPSLVKPILEQKADIVIGARPISNIRHFSILKKIFQKLGSFMVRLVSNTSVQDAPSGFRAFTKQAAIELNVFSKYTYTIETIIQAGIKGFVVVSVPIKVNKDLRPSKLVKNISSYIRTSVSTMIRIFILYKPFKTFFITGLFFF